MKVIRTMFRAAGFAAAAYGGYAALTWLRYGHTKNNGPASTLDRLLPDPEAVERHSIGVNAPPEVTWKAVCDYDVMESRIAQLLFDTRAIAMGAKIVHAELPKGLIEQMKAIGWAVLEETPGHEIVFGVAAQPWVPDAGFRTIPPDDFATFNTPGWVKIALNVSVDSVARCCSLLRTETRVAATDASARKNFRNYWAFVTPGVKLIRVAVLHAIKANAEEAVQKTLRSAAAAA